MNENDFDISEVHDKSSYEALKSDMMKYNNLSHIIKALTNLKDDEILGNTRLLREEIDILVLNKEIGDRIYNNMINYYKNEKKFSNEDLKLVKISILKTIVQKNLLGRWSFNSRSREELMTVGIGSFKDEVREQSAQPLINNIPLLRRII